MYQNRCKTCEADTAYYLEVMTSPGTCFKCQTTVSICYGGSKIGPLPGYWRKNATTSTFIKCPNSPACLGIQSPHYNP